MKNLINKCVKLSLLPILTVFLWITLVGDNIVVAQYKNNVPDYYYANYKFIDDWDPIRDLFQEMRASYELDKDIEMSKFAELATHFNNSFPYLTKDFRTVYDKCSILANSLAREYSNSDFEALMWNGCYKSLREKVNIITESYTVLADGEALPKSGPAPLSVTFDARSSIDPSKETIPTDNYFWYYRDEKGVDVPMWKGNVINYTFKEPGRFIVHLVVRSSNVDDWILDGEKNFTIDVSTKAADIVIYANTRRMSQNSPLKIWISEWEKWVVFDGSLTSPRWWNKIKSHRWKITNQAVWFSFDSKEKEWAPGAITQKLNWNWEFKVTLSIKDNQNNTYEESFYLFMSDPVTIIKQSPDNWTTSTTFNFDASSSYSITNKLDTYIWEVFDNNWSEENWRKILTEQGKKLSLNMSDLRKKPWNYQVRLTVSDVNKQQNTDTKNLYIESTSPVPQFTITSTSKWQYPSEFILDASNSSDIDEINGFDSLEYSRSFWSEDAKIVSSEKNNQKVIVQFNKVWEYIVKLTVTDQYWKSSSVSRVLNVESTLRPEIDVNPAAITLWKPLQFKGTINEDVINYAWSFWDRTSVNSEFAKEVTHEYGESWVYPVSLTVSDREWNSNTVTEKVFIWETEAPIAAYKVKDDKWYYIQSSDICKIPKKGDDYDAEYAYPIDRYGKFTIDPSISINTKWNSIWLQYVFEKEAIMWVNKAQRSTQITESFSQLWCHYVDLTVQDSNVWKLDKERIWFNVKNALPTIRNLTLTFPQYTDDLSIGYNTTSNRTLFDCSWTNNLTIKVTAVDARDPDWTISRLRFYYYNVDDPDRILEYKETWISIPYVYFVIPRISWEYKFWVMVYDNDGWMMDSRESIASNPSVYFASACGDADVPSVTLKVDSQNIQVWDTVTYSVISKISSNSSNFETDRTFYYDFTWDWVRDLVTKKDTVTYTFEEAYEDWISPKAAVEYRWKLWNWEWARIVVKSWIKPILLYNSIWNTVIFRDMSIWAIQQKQICFDVDECQAGNKKYKRSFIASEDVDYLNWWTSLNSIKEKDTFLQDYPEYWTHNVSLYMKNKYGIEVEKTYEVKTSNNVDNWRIAPGINMITIPETTMTNWTPEVFLSKAMNNSLLMYINNDNDETCYVDTDIATDSDWDAKADNDKDIMCNKLAKILYQPDYETAIWRIYFTNNWSLTFKNFYVTFEWIIIELDDEKREIYDDITVLVNGIEDLNIENTDLKSLLDKLRKNLNNKSEVSSLIMMIKEKISEWWIKMSSTQKDILDSVVSRLENEDTIVSVWKSEYEKNREEILELLPTTQWLTIKSTVEEMFKNFEEKVWDSQPEERYNLLNDIRNYIIDNSQNNKLYNENDFTPYFCNIYDHYDIWLYTNKCWLDIESVISNNYKGDIAETSSKSESGWLPTRLKIILIVLFWGLLTMWWIIVFFSIKARINSNSEDEEEW